MPQIHRRSDRTVYPFISVTALMALGLTACGGQDTEALPDESPGEDSAQEDSTDGDQELEGDEPAEPDSDDETSEDEESEADAEDGQQPEEEEPEPEEETEAEPEGDAAEGEAAEDDDAAEADSEEGQEAPPEGGVEIDPTQFDSELKASEGFPETLLSPGSEEDLLLQDVRLGVHENHDRVVFDHTETGLPGWQVEYVDQAVQPGSGQPIEMDGEAFLAVSVTGMSPGNAAEDQGQLILETTWDEHDTIVEGTATTIAQHGAASYYISLDEVRDFDVVALEEGSRLVIDILH